MAENSDSSIGAENEPKADLPPPPPGITESDSAVAATPSDQGKSGWIKQNLVVIAVGVVALLVGVGIGGLAFGSSNGSSGGGSASSKSTVTTQRQATATTTTTIAYVPVPTDFQIGIVETRRSCFGSAGCNITFQIDPSYVGTSSLSPSKTYTVVYQVNGGDSPKTANFTITGSQASFREDTISTPPGANLSAVATRVLPG
jgi:hypothetical protein